VFTTLPIAPHWWLLDVTDEATGQPVRHVRVDAASTTSGAINWDGGDWNGIVVDAGAYALQVTAEDLDGRRAEPCRQVVRVQHGPRTPQ